MLGYNKMYKGLNDKKEYECMVLPCDLEVLLVSTSKVHAEGKIETSQRSAAALSVQVGSFADPQVAEGCAHFLEHMVFMGSTKYPDENYYDSFVTTHGGSCNAFTEGEYTCYQFEVDSPFFAEALDIFIHCIRDPLLASSAAEREIRAIHSEFNLAKVDDDSRVQQLLCHQSLEGHVLGKFSWGNLQSLHEIPSQNGIDVESVLRSFHHHHYLPNAMKLVVVGPQSLDELKANVLLAADGEWPTATSPLPQSTIRLKSLSECMQGFIGIPPLPSSSLKTVTRIASLKRKHKLLLRWQLPPTHAQYKNKCCSILGHLIGHEGEGSLLCHLKECGLATHLSADTGSGYSFDCNSMFNFLSVEIQLTWAGFSNWIAVVGHVCTYIQMLKETNLPEWLFEELKQIAQNSFDFMDEEGEEELAERLSVEMLPLRCRDRNELLQAEVLFWDFDSPGISEIISSISTIRKAKIILLSPFFGRGGESCSEEDEDLDGDDDDEDDDESGEDGDSENDSDASDSLSYTSTMLKDAFNGPEKWREFNSLSPQSNALVEPHFGTQYWTDAIPEDLYVAWDQLPNGVWNSQHKSYSFEVNNYQLPPPNPFIATELSLLRASSDIVEPILTKVDEGLNLWHCLNTRYSTPKVELYIRLSSNAIFGSSALEHAKNALLLDLFAKLVKESLNKIIYMASMADLECHFIVSDVALTVRVSGYSHKACILAENIINFITSSRESSFSESIISMQLNDLQSSYENALMKSSSLATTARLLALKPSKVGPEEKLGCILHWKDIGMSSKKNSVSDIKKSTNVLKKGTKKQPNNSKLVPSKSSKVEVERIDNGSEYVNNVIKGEMFPFLRNLMGHLYIDILAEGNIVLSTAESMCQSLTSMKKAGCDMMDIKLSAKHFPEQPIIKLPRQKLFILKQVPRSPKEENTCVEVYFQSCEYNRNVNVDVLCKLDLLEQLLCEPFFDQLRTKKQLGYELSCGSRQTFGVLGFCFRVVSSSHSLQELQNELLDFAYSCSELCVASLTKEVFVQNVLALVAKKVVPPKSLKEQSEMHWSEIEDHRYDFASHEQQAQLLRGFVSDDESALRSQAELAAFASQLFVLEPRLLMIHAATEKKHNQLTTAIKAKRKRSNKQKRNVSEDGLGVMKVSQKYASICSIQVLESPRDLHELCGDRYYQMV